MTKQRREAAAAVRVAAGLGQRKQAELVGLLRPVFARTGPWVQAGRYVGAVMCDLPKRNGWTRATASATGGGHRSHLDHRDA